ncbi:hypothetical protein NPIL_23291 [Nephila pilipes]|uniref:Uncharacterized protein n=1 Tax=Nephila pilipes TaxID=299642 RepID=A0A8X6U618_NEPPI|nr:hypothetical protein NPIL_23291 [Nephila pilipes]
MIALARAEFGTNPTSKKQDREDNISIVQLLRHSVTSHGVKVVLVRAKSRVAPLKQVTIPRFRAYGVLHRF